MVLCARLLQGKRCAASAGFSGFVRALAKHWRGGRDHGGILIRAEGEDNRGSPAIFQWQILGLNGDSPWISAAPAAAMARKLVREAPPFSGARACWQLLDLEDILAELTPYSVVTALERLEPESPLAGAAPDPGNP